MVPTVFYSIFFGYFQLELCQNPSKSETACSSRSYNSGSATGTGLQLRCQQVTQNAVQFSTQMSTWQDVLNYFHSDTCNEGSVAFAWLIGTSDLRVIDNLVPNVEYASCSDA